ncbi:prolyl oligopeptidase family serine peptidase [bacterium]|nr:prolyl oligopeptidase family serine peptidase [bacterium]
MARASACLIHGSARMKTTRKTLATMLALGWLGMTSNQHAAAQGGLRPMTVEDLLAVKSVSGLKISPDGRMAVYSVTEPDKATGKSISNLWYSIISREGSPKRLTTTSARDSEPVWAPDGKSIYFLSTRSGSAQIWNIAIDGGEARQVTKLPIDVAGGPAISADGKLLAFPARVYPGKSPKETVEEDKKRGEAKSKAMIFDKLMIRHWDTYDDGKRSHIFVADTETGEARDLSPDLTSNSPPAPFGGSSDYTFSPDSKTVVFTAEPLKDHAWSTNNDLWQVSVAGGPLKNLTDANTGADSYPLFSPDGKHLAYLRQTRAKFEADQNVLTVLELATGKVTELTRKLDRTVHEFSWVGDGSGIVAGIENEGHQDIFLIDPAGTAPPRKVIGGKGMHTAIQSPRKGGLFVYLRNDSVAPNDVFYSREDANGPTVTKRLSSHNDDVLADLDLTAAEPFTFEGADDAKVQGWITRPPGFDPAKKYPVLYLIHGGPQSAWTNTWHARWNSNLFAAPGYVVVAVNPRGSTGFGQEFTDQISRDWNGRVYVDLMKGLDHVLKTYPYMDSERVGAAGGSYGGYMVNWIAGQTDRFKCLISHAGVWDLPSMYGTTEELWFAEWEFGGPPWEKEYEKGYQSQSPSNFAGNIKTPVLVTHGSLDYRVPEAQGFGLFTALQRRGVPSRLVLFPDENHWILKADNRRVWWREMHAWLKTYLKP